VIRLRVLALAGFGLLTLLSACESDKDVQPPASLVDFRQKMDVKRVWDLKIGEKDRRLRLGLAPTVVDGTLYAAGQTGDVFAVNAKTGHIIWHARSKLPLSGGPGVGAGLVVVGTMDGQLLALDMAKGNKVWLVRTSAEVLSAPTVSANVVLVRTVDGRIRALAHDDGHDLWASDESVPRLSLRGTGRPVVTGDAVVCGFDDGKVVAYNLAGGETLWQTTVSSARGKTELERMVDIDGELAVSGHDVFAVGFQGRLAMLALDTGQIWWARDLSSYRGLTVDGETLYVTTADSVVGAYRRRDGAPIWTQDKLARRGLTAPAIDGDTLVVVDYQGYVHWIDRATGELFGRIHTHKDRVTNTPVVADGMVFVQTDGDRLYALRAHRNTRVATPASPKTGAKMTATDATQKSDTTQNP
jgi:outer membrane protein assembly factor BamB